MQFLSTPSVGRATVRRVQRRCGASGISIHALRGEGDHAVGLIEPFRVISIHALRGEGDMVSTDLFLLLVIFLSTPSVGRATRVSNRVPSR